MAIKVNSTNVIDDNKNLINIENISASGSVSGNILATSADALAGISSTKLMTPDTTAVALAAKPSVSIGLAVALG